MSTPIGHRTEADYEIRLTERVAAWEKKHLAEAHELRTVTRRRLGMAVSPTPGSLTWLMLEREFREEVRKLHADWPTLRAWLKERDV